MDPIDIIVGFDQREAAVYHVFCQSVLERASVPVRFLPLARNTLSVYPGLQTDGSNAFTYTRFLCPYLMGFKGWALFADGDMVCRDDIVKLWALRDPSRAVQVVQHDYRTKAHRKYLGNANEDYPRKNWSSVILWNCGHPDNAVLTPEFVARHDGRFLHRFQWLRDESIGALAPEWNWLAVEYEPNPAAKIVHYTLGAPCFREYRETDMAQEWHRAHARATQGFEP